MDIKSRIPDKWFYFPIIVFSIILIIKLIQLSQIIHYFPLHIGTDVGALKSYLFFFVKYGFGSVPNWYNGFYLFRFYPPGWFFFTLPLYKLTNNLGVSTYISLILTLILGFVSVFFLGKSQRISIVKRIAFFLIFFANPITVSQALSYRPTELFVWPTFILLFLIIVYYKNHKINKYFWFFIPLYAILSISYPPIFMFGSIMVFSLFLIKNLREKILIAFFTLVSLALTSFWLIPFIKITVSTGITQTRGLYELTKFTSATLIQNIYTTIIILAFFISFYFYWRDKNKLKKELLFYLPSLILAFLFLTRAIIFIPILKKIWTDTYMMFFIFMIIFLFFKTKFKAYKIRKFIFYGLLLLPIFSLFFIFVYQEPDNLSIAYTPIEKELISVFPHVDGRLLIPTNKSQTTRAANWALPTEDIALAYATVYHNISTPWGFLSNWAPPNLTKKVESIPIYLANRDCDNLIKTLKELETTNIITYNEYCEILEACGFIEKIKKEHVCLFYY